VRTALILYCSIFTFMMVALIISISRVHTYGESSMQVCINGKCEMVSNHDRYRVENTCEKDECNISSPPINSTKR